MLWNRKLAAERRSTFLSQRSSSSLFRWALHWGKPTPARLQDWTGCQIRLWSVKFADQSVVSPGGFQTVSTCHIRLLSAPNLSLLPLCLKSQLPPAMWLLHCCTDLSNYAALQGHHPCWYWEPSVHLYREPMHRGYSLNSSSHSLASPAEVNDAIHWLQFCL